MSPCFCLTCSSFLLVTKTQPILVTWSNIYTLCFYDRWESNRDNTQFLGGFICSAWCVVCLVSLYWSFWFCLVLEKHDGGTNKTTNSCGVPPGWTWSGWRRRPVRHELKVALRPLFQSVCYQQQQNTALQVVSVANTWCGISSDSTKGNAKEIFGFGDLPCLWWLFT